MYQYSVDQWILLFFLYSFAGYLWEVAYVSLRSRKLVNRGFLFGPILPIYGFGAITIPSSAPRKAPHQAKVLLDITKWRQRCITSICSAGERPLV